MNDGANIRAGQIPPKQKAFSGRLGLLNGRNGGVNRQGAGIRNEPSFGPFIMDGAGSILPKVGRELLNSAIAYMASSFYD